MHILLPIATLDTPDFEDNWCKKNGYKRNRYNPSKEQLLKSDSQETSQSPDSKYRSIRKLIEIYSPIHSMIVRVNKQIQREQALQMSAGGWVKACWSDFSNVSVIFNQHVHELGDDNLKMWLEIEKEIKERNGFLFGKREQEWFDRLNAEYNRLKNTSWG